MPQEHKPENQGGHAAAEQGIVVLDGPDGIAVTMTVEAAENTAQSLVAAAAEARKQHKPAS